MTFFIQFNQGHGEKERKKKETKKIKRWLNLHKRPTVGKQRSKLKLK